MPTTEPSPRRTPPRRRKDSALQYRWGMVGLILAIGFFAWYLNSRGVTLSPVKPGEGATKNLEKIVCPRCKNDPEKKPNCALCGGLGFIWVDKTRDPGNATNTPAQ